MLDQFECVRLVRMNGIDLNQFQFDYDQTWAAMFLRHDGTVLARYGTRGDRDGMTFNSLAGLTTTMRSVLAVNAEWNPESQKKYAAKKGPKSQHATADEIPSETISRIAAQEKQGNQSCIHCHNVYDGLRDHAIANGNYDPAKRYKYPLPQNIGLEVDGNSGTMISHVIPGSPAAKTGLQSGQQIRMMNGQPIHSIADIQFVLHNLGERAEVAIDVSDPESAAVSTEKLSLVPGWKFGDIGWRASMYGMPPKPGLWVEAASNQEKAKLGIEKSLLALKVRGVFGRDVRKSGLKKGDVITRFAKETAHHSEGDFHAHLRLNYYKPNAKLPLKLIRDGRARELTVTFANN